MNRKEAWPSYRISSGVRLCWVSKNLKDLKAALCAASLLLGPHSQAFCLGLTLTPPTERWTSASRTSASFLSGKTLPSAHRSFTVQTYLAYRFSRVQGCLTHKKYRPMVFPKGCFFVSWGGGCGVYVAAAVLFDSVQRLGSRWQLFWKSKQIGRPPSPCL